MKMKCQIEKYMILLQLEDNTVATEEHSKWSLFMFLCEEGMFLCCEL